MVLPSSVCVKSSKTARGSSQVLNEPRFLALYGMDKPTLEAGPKQQLSTFLSAHILAGIDLLHDNTCTAKWTHQLFDPKSGSNEIQRRLLVLLEFAQVFFSRILCHYVTATP